MSQCTWVPARRLYISAVDELITIIPSACIIGRKISLLFLYLHLLGSQKETVFLNSKEKKKKKSYHISHWYSSLSLSPHSEFSGRTFQLFYYSFGEERHFRVLSEWLSLWSPDRLCPTAVVPVRSATGLQPPFFSLQSSLWEAVGRRCPGLLIAQQIHDLLQQHKWGEV